MSLMFRAIMEEEQFQGQETGLTLIVEDGSIVANANTYVDMTFCSNYQIMMGNTDWVSYAQVDREAAILRAMRWLENFEGKWKGARATRSQALSWPRVNMLDHDGYEIEDSVIPTDLKEAVCEAAYQEIKSKDVFNPGLSAGNSVLEKRVKAGPVEAQYKYSQGTSLADAFPAILDMIKHYMVFQSTRRMRA